MGIKSQLFICCLIATGIFGLDVRPCPVTALEGNLLSGSIITTFNGGLVPLIEGQQTACYNFSLPYSLRRAPDVAVGVEDFEIDPSYNMFFYVKPLTTDSTTFIPFVIRTLWSYTSWNLITFNFLAQDRNDMDSGFHQVDSGALAGCHNGGAIQLLLPFKIMFANGQPIQHSLFLHGYQITTLAVSSARSPFQIQISQSSANISGIAVQLSVTTTTQVNFLFISYVAYQTLGVQYQAGNFVYDPSYQPLLSYTPVTTIPRNYARIYGLTGFIINFVYGQIALDTVWDSFTFTFNFKQSVSLVQYFSFEYIFFTGSECENCPGYPYASNGTCVNFCPAGTYLSGGKYCLSCGEGRVWNGTHCIIECPQGQFLNTTNNKCQCPLTMNWNGELCISCHYGRVWQPINRTCVCPPPLRWNGNTCVAIPECTGGKEWDVYTYSCKCPDYQYERGGRCFDIPICTGGRILNTAYNCVCPQNYVWSSERCIYTPCFGGQAWTGSSCICPANLHWNGTMCIQCINGQVWNSIQKVCSCDAGYQWNGQYCDRTYECSHNRIWNATYQQCICPQNYYWTGYACLPVPTCTGGQVWDLSIKKCACVGGRKFNGTDCVLCTNGKIWNPQNLTCYCPPGTVETNTGACVVRQTCTGGKIWIQALWSCACPQETVWNGNYCISNPCNFGRVWNERFRSCQCPDKKVWINNACVPPQIACTNGRVWNGYIYACECPVGTYPAQLHCESIPICTDGKTYNPLTNQCNCPFGLVQQNYRCVDPSCPTGQYWNGYDCVVISCPPPSYFYENRCVYGGSNTCNFGYIWNGNQCSYYPSTCPSGTSWNQLSCQSTGVCNNGYYMGSGGSCQILPQQCTPPSTWTGNSCGVAGGICPSGTYYNEQGQCMPYVPCENGHIWDTTYLRCICTVGKISNGKSCIDCPSSKIWDPVNGCTCPEGSFDTGVTCEPASQSRCSIITNAIWQNNRCVCRPGFTKVGFQCVCYGTQVGTLCDKCSYKPNSEWIQATNMCQCLSTYTEINGHCVPRGSQIGNDDPTRCSVSTYFNQDHKMCLPCSPGCLSCSDYNHCKTCRPEFIFNSLTSMCIQMCGDGRKFVLGCDDGNNLDGDGCSQDCRVEPGYTCRGGSPDGRDNCYVYVPTAVTFQQVGQVRMPTSIVINVNVNYIPQSLLYSTECSNSCSQILSTTIISGDTGAQSVTSKYVAGSYYMFTITVEFGRPYMGDFELQVRIKNSLTQFFGGISISNPLVISVNPSYLAAVGGEAEVLQ